jgi:hypothetical protein
VKTYLIWVGVNDGAYESMRTFTVKAYNATQARDRARDTINGWERVLSVEEYVG